SAEIIDNADHSILHCRSSRSADNNSFHGGNHAEFPQGDRGGRARPVPGAYTGPTRAALAAEKLPPLGIVHHALVIEARIAGLEAELLLVARLVGVLRRAAQRRRHFAARGHAR